MEHTNIDAILARHLAAEPLTEEQRQTLEAYIDANGTEYRRLVDAMERLDREGRDIQVDTATAWQKVESRLAESPHKARAVRLRALWVAAAALLLLVGFGFYSLFGEAPAQTFANHSHRTEQLRLPDGTTVRLHPQATLAYRASDRKAERRVELTGRAFFDVSHDGRSFTVTAGEMRVEVLGTSFSVDARLKGNERVSVKTGRVLVTAAGQKAVLTRGQQASLNHGTLRKSADRAETLQPVFVFKDTPIREAVDRMAREMDIRIELDPQLDDGNRITTQLRSANPTEAIREIALLCNCRYDSVSPIHYRIYK